MMLKKFLVFSLCWVLAACSMKQGPVLWQDKHDVEEEKRTASTVAVLLPLSGESKKVGESMQKAALLQTFHQQDAPLKVLFFDTESTPVGAEQAYRWALAQKPDIVLGPVFSKEVQAIQNSGVSVPLLTFTSDTTLINDKVGTMAVTVIDQVKEIVKNACFEGQTRLGVLAPDNKTGEIALNALSEVAETCSGMTLKKVSVYDANTMNFTQAVQKIVPPLIDAKKKDLTEQEKAELARPMSERAGLDAIILFEEGIKLRQLLSLLAFYDAGPKDIPIYALTVAKQVDDSNANFVYFADLDDARYPEFENQYMTMFGKKPIRIASQIYDALGFIASEADAGHSIQFSDLVKQNGYEGVDGFVQLHENGLNERALQLKQKKGKHSTLIRAAERPEMAPVTDTGWSSSKPSVTALTDSTLTFPQE